MVIAIFSLPACSDASKPLASNTPDKPTSSPAAEITSGNVQPPNSPDEKVTVMSTQQVITRILQKDWDMVEVPGAISPDAAPEIIKLLDNPDPEVRELAIYSLNASGGEAAKEGFLKALNDENEMQVLTLQLWPQTIAGLYQIS